MADPDIYHRTFGVVIPSQKFAALLEMVILGDERRA